MNNSDVLLWNDRILKDNKEISRKQKKIISNLLVSFRVHKFDFVNITQTGETKKKQYFVRL